MSDLLKEWLVSSVSGTDSPMDCTWLPELYTTFSGNNNFTFGDFYANNDDIDIELTKLITFHNTDLEISECPLDESEEYDQHCEYNEHDESKEYDEVCDQINEEQQMPTYDRYNGKHYMSNQEFVDCLSSFDSEICEEKCKDKCKKLLRCVEHYGNKSVFIPPGINLSHVSMLFKMMIDVVKHRDMKITLPEISYSGGKYTISQINEQMFTPQQKKAFYQFCYDNTSQKHKAKNFGMFRRKRMVPPILTKELYGRLQLNSALKITRQLKQKREGDESTMPLKLLTYEDLNKMLNNINEQHVKFNNWIIELWEEVFEKYLSTKNIDCCVLDRLKTCSGKPINGVDRNGTFRVFCKNFPLFSKIEKLRYRVKLTLEKQSIEYRKKQAEDFKKSQQIKRIDTRQLYGK